VLLALVVCDREGDTEYIDEGTDEDEGDSSSPDEGTSDSTGARAEWNTFDERPCPEDSELTWENFGGPFVLTYCTGCHHSELPAGMRQDAPQSIDFENVALVRDHAPRVWARAADQNATMPPAGAPASDERELLGEWLACGAPTNEDLGLLE
jgi:hypothetical protein